MSLVRVAEAQGGSSEVPQAAVDRLGRQVGGAGPVTRRSARGLVSALEGVLGIQAVLEPVLTGEAAGMPEAPAVSDRPDGRRRRMCGQQLDVRPVQPHGQQVTDRGSLQLVSEGQLQRPRRHVRRRCDIGERDLRVRVRLDELDGPAEPRRTVFWSLVLASGAHFSGPTFRPAC